MSNITHNISRVRLVVCEFTPQFDITDEFEKIRPVKQVFVLRPNNQVREANDTS